jgi:hypothetical protein
MTPEPHTPDPGPSTTASRLRVIQLLSRLLALVLVAWVGRRFGTMPGTEAGDLVSLSAELLGIVITLAVDYLLHLKQNAKPTK